jgi:ANTAR domain
VAEVVDELMQPRIINQARSARSRAARERRRAEYAQQHAATLVQQSATLLLAAEQTRLHVTRKELLGRSECSRSWARMETRPMIEQAKRILMAQCECGPEAAFDMLRRASQRSNVPVRKLAARIVVMTADDFAAGFNRAAASA